MLINFVKSYLQIEKPLHQSRCATTSEIPRILVIIYYYVPITPYLLHLYVPRYEQYFFPSTTTDSFVLDLIAYLFITDGFIMKKLPNIVRVEFNHKRFRWAMSGITKIFIFMC